MGCAPPPHPLALLSALMLLQGCNPVTEEPPAEPLMRLILLLGSYILRGDKPAPEQLLGLMIKVYSRYPIPQLVGINP